VSWTPLALGAATGVALITAIVAASRQGSPVPARGFELGDAASIVVIVALAIGFALYTGALVALRPRDGCGGAGLALVIAAYLLPARVPF
jgi:hypothetical protein